MQLSLLAQQLSALDYLSLNIVLDLNSLVSYVTIVEEYVPYVVLVLVD